MQQLFTLKVQSFIKHGVRGVGRLLKRGHILGIVNGEIEYTAKSGLLF